ncbi:hypothetical protein [Eubacterium aggregans]|uniref:hypothetical protein n=1 Tax=Eubacterium aggregans TaxID=81409 RepID=UPI003F322FE6
MIQLRTLYRIHNIFSGDEEVDDYEFELYDAEEAITKFRELCQPEVSFSDSEKKCWFYLTTYYLYKIGYEIKEFPRVLARPHVEPSDFTYGGIRNRIIAEGDDDNGTVRYVVRRKFVASLNFELKSSHIDIDNLIDQKFIEISNRQASFNKMSTDEKLAEIANLIENLLKKNGKFITLDYPKICFDYISNEIVTRYRKKMHCFRHATDEAIEKRNSYSEEQKNFFVDYGLTIVKVIHSLLK